MPRGGRSGFWGGEVLRGGDMVRRVSGGCSVGVNGAGGVNRAGVWCGAHVRGWSSPAKSVIYRPENLLVGGVRGGTGLWRAEGAEELIFGCVWGRLWGLRKFGWIRRGARLITRLRQWCEGELRVGF